MGAVSQLMAKSNVRIRRGLTEMHRDQGVVERFNRTLAERLFGYQYAKELEEPHKRNREWVKRLPEVVKALNAETKKTSSCCDGKCRFSHLSACKCEVFISARRIRRWWQKTGN